MKSRETGCGHYHYSLNSMFNPFTYSRVVREYKFATKEVKYYTIFNILLYRSISNY
jgi:hypothetical protein